jgi:hypothetical protein
VPITPSAEAAGLARVNFEPGKWRNQMRQLIKKRKDDYFGLCPHCKSYTGCVKAGKTDIVYCAEHQISWIAGSGLFSSFHTLDEQRAIYDEIGIGEMERIERPFFWPPTLRERVSNWLYERRHRRWLKGKVEDSDIPF